MKKMISTRAVFDIETGALIERDRIPYEGPMELCTFVRRLPLIVPSQGSPLLNDTLFLKQTFVLSGTTAQTNTMSGFVPSLACGKVRVKFTVPSTSGVSPAISSCYLVLDDGTTFVQIGSISSNVLAIQGAANSAASIPNNVDHVREFEVDIQATRLSIYSTLTGTSPIILMDVEISGTAGNS